MTFLISATVMLFVVFVAMSLGEHWHQEDRDREDADRDWPNDVPPPGPSLRQA